MRKVTILAGWAVLALASPAFAQQSYPTGASTVRVPGNVPLQCNSAVTACTPVSAANPQTTSAAGDVASGATDSGNPVKIGCKYSASYSSLTDQQRGNVACNAFGNILVSVAGAPIAIGDSVTPNMTLGNNAVTPSTSIIPTVLPQVWNGTSISVQRGDTLGSWVNVAPSSTAAVGTASSVTGAVASALVVKASAGNLYGINVVAGASAGFVLVFNATTAPADGAVTPVRCIPLAAGAGIELNYRGPPLAFSTGITVVFSTTGCFAKTASATAFIAADAK